MPERKLNLAKLQTPGEPVSSPVWSLKSLSRTNTCKNWNTRTNQHIPMQWKWPRSHETFRNGQVIVSNLDFDCTPRQQVLYKLPGQRKWMHPMLMQVEKEPAAIQSTHSLPPNKHQLTALPLLLPCFPSTLRWKRNTTPHLHLAAALGQIPCSQSVIKTPWCYWSEPVLSVEGVVQKAVQSSPGPTVGIDRTSIAFTC